MKLATFISSAVSVIISASMLYTSVNDPLSGKYHNYDVIFSSIFLVGSVTLSYLTFKELISK